MFQPARRRDNSVQFTVSKPGKFTDDQFTANWDHEFRNSKDSIAAPVLLLRIRSRTFPFGAGGLQASLGARSQRYRLEFSVSTADS